MQALQIFHVNVNCSNLERSLAFYKRLGFREVIDFNDTADGEELGEPQLGPALGSIRAAHQVQQRVRFKSLRPVLQHQRDVVDAPARLPLSVTRQLPRAELASRSNRTSP